MPPSKRIKSETIDVEEWRSQRRDHTRTQRRRRGATVIDISDDSNDEIQVVAGGVSEIFITVKKTKYRFAAHTKIEECAGGASYDPPSGDCRAWTTIGHSPRSTPVGLNVNFII